MKYHCKNRLYDVLEAAQLQIKVFQIHMQEEV